MSNRILLKRSGNAAAVPAAANLLLGELSLNYTDGVLYFLNSSNVVTVLANANTISSTQLSNGNSNVVVSNNSNVTISSAGTANVLTVSNTGAYVTGVVSATGNITGNYILGNGSQLTGLPATYGNSNVVTLLTAYGSNTISTTGNITAGYFIGNGSALTGLPSTSGLIWTTQANTAPVGAHPGDFWYNSTTGIKYQYTNDGTGNSWVDQSAPTSFANISVSNTATIGNIVTSGTVSVTSNITGGNILFGSGIVSGTGNITAGYFIGNGSQLTGLAATYGNSNVTALLAAFGSNTISTSGTVTSGNITGSNLLTGGLVSASGTITGTSHIGSVVSVTGAVTAASVVGGVMSGSSLTVTTGTITGGNIVNGNGNGVGNIGSSTTYFNTVFAKATSAQYADLAEMYCADGNYAPGTVVEFGGDNEVTATTESHSTRVAGIISTNPSYLMNSTLDCSNALEVALVGRVPCSVVGTIRKGDRLVSSGILGVAQALNMNLYEPGCIVGKALEDYNLAEPGMIEVAVGRI